MQCVTASCGRSIDETGARLVAYRLHGSYLEFLGNLERLTESIAADFRDGARLSRHTSELAVAATDLVKEIELKRVASLAAAATLRAQTAVQKNVAVSSSSTSAASAGLCGMEWPVCPDCPPASVNSTDEGMRSSGDRTWCPRCHRSWKPKDLERCPRPADTKIRHETGTGRMCRAHALAAQEFLTGTTIVEEHEKVVPFMPATGSPLGLSNDPAGPRHYLAGRLVAAGTQLELWRDGRWDIVRYEWACIEGAPVRLSTTSGEFGMPVHARFRWPKR